MPKAIREEKETQLALLGGRPALAEQPPAWPYFDQSDRDALGEVLESRVWGGYHQKVGELERRFAEFHGARYGIAMANGTISLEIALMAAGIGPGDEVIVPPVTFVASATSILRIGAVPVFVDLDPGTLNIHPQRIAEAIGERTRAVVAVHFAGHPADLDALTGLCAQKGLKLIEDCAHAHGAAWRGRRVGGFGQFGSFSFQASKNMTAGEGGMLVTDDPELAELARSISNQGRRTGGAWYEHARLGTNARLTGFQAALLLNQLGRLPQEVSIRRGRAARLRAGLAEIGGLVPMPEAPDPRVTAHGYHLFIMRYDERVFGGLSRDRFVEALRAEGVPATTGYPYPLYRNELFRDQRHVVEPCPVAEEICGSWIWLPHNALLAGEEWIDGVLAAVRKIRAGAGALLSAA